MDCCGLLWCGFGFLWVAVGCFGLLWVAVGVALIVAVAVDGCGLLWVVGCCGCGCGGGLL